MLEDSILSALILVQIVKLQKRYRRVCYTLQILAKQFFPHYPFSALYLGHFMLFGDHIEPCLININLDLDIYFQKVCSVHCTAKMKEICIYFMNEKTCVP